MERRSRSVTPAVAGSSPVAPVLRSACGRPFPGRSASRFCWAPEVETDPPVPSGAQGVSAGLGIERSGVGEAQGGGGGGEVYGGSGVGLAPGGQSWCSASVLSRASERLLRTAHRGVGGERNCSSLGVCGPSPSLASRSSGGCDPDGSRWGWGLRPQPPLY